MPVMWKDRATKSCISPKHLKCLSPKIIGRYVFAGLPGIYTHLLTCDVIDAVVLEEIYKC